MVRRKSRRKRRRSRRMRAGAPEKLYGDGAQLALGGQRGRLQNTNWEGEGHRIVQEKIDEIIDDCCGDFEAADAVRAEEAREAFRAQDRLLRVLEQRVDHLERQGGGNGGNGGNGGGGGGGGGGQGAPAHAPPPVATAAARAAADDVAALTRAVLLQARVLGENPAGRRTRMTAARTGRPRFFYTQEQRQRLGVDEAGGYRRRGPGAPAQAPPPAAAAQAPPPAAAAQAPPPAAAARAADDGDGGLTAAGMGRSLRGHYSDGQNGGRKTRRKQRGGTKKKAKKKTAKKKAKKKPAKKKAKKKTAKKKAKKKPAKKKPAKKKAKKKETYAGYTKEELMKYGLGPNKWYS